MAKRTHHPAQLSLDFDAPIAVAPTALPFGMPVTFDLGPASITVSTPEKVVLGHVLGHLVQTLGRMLSAVDVTISATLGEIDDRAFEVIVMRTTDDGSFRNVVRCARVGADLQLAA